MKMLALIHFASASTETGLCKEIAPGMRMGAQTFPTSVPCVPGVLHDLRYLAHCTEPLLTVPCPCLISFQIHDFICGESRIGYMPMHI